jgi:2-polyprenyl-3-methyl-5-hydroxy-6-metoxy-1,4-benzoquinol methylase
VPYFLRNYIRFKINECKTNYNNRKLKSKIIKYFLDNSESLPVQDGEKMEIINFLNRNSFSVFPYNFCKKYNHRKVIVHADLDHNMKYVLENEKRIYFQRGWSKEQIKKYYNGLLIEQDLESPHRYEFGDFSVQRGDVVVDVGCGEGNFALSVVERCKKMYLFESDEDWIDVLRKTFYPWREKVVIVNSYVSDNNDNKNIRLDDYFSNEDVDFLKIDIEGAELPCLRGAERLISRNTDLRAAVCTYHKDNDVENLTKVLKAHNFHIDYSKGYMIFRYDKTLAPPYLRKGLIRATKNKEV